MLLLAFLELWLIWQLVGGEKKSVTFGHPSGALKVGAIIENQNGKPVVKSATLSRSARILMEGYVFVPADTF